MCCFEAGTQRGRQQLLLSQNFSSHAASSINKDICFLSGKVLLYCAEK